MSSRAVRAREKEDRVVALRLAGMDFEEIRKQVGYRDRSGAWKAYQRALERRSVPAGADADGMREDEVNLELLRLDELQKRIWARAMRGDLAAYDRVLKVMERRDKLKHRYHSAKANGPRPEGRGGEGVVVEQDVLDELREKRRAGR